jgi:molybdopterin synthase catalytic subunit
MTTSSTITVRYFAAARAAVGVDVEVVAIEAAGTVAALRTLLVTRHPALARVLRQSRIAVNERFVADDSVVVAGADVAVIPPVAGG